MTSLNHSQPDNARAPAAWRRVFSKIKALALNAKPGDVPETLAHIARLCIDAGAAPFAERNWTEDASHENGNYECLCCECDQMFIGHKRRVLCKACSNLLTSHAGSGVLTSDAWQPIETAPKDGSLIFLYWPPVPYAKKNWGTIRLGTWNGTQWKLEMAGHFRTDCTNWMPLPAAPSLSSANCSWPDCDQPSGHDYCYDHCLAALHASPISSTEGK